MALDARKTRAAGLFRLFCTFLRSAESVSATARETAGAGLAGLVFFRLSG